MDSKFLASHGNSIGSFDLQLFQRRLEDYLNGETEEEEKNALPLAIESRESSQPQSLDVGPFDLFLLHINANKYQSTPCASRDTTARNSPSKFTTVGSNPQTVGCISQCMDTSFRGQATPRQYVQVSTYIIPNTSGYASTPQDESIPIPVTTPGNPNFSNPSYPPQVTSYLPPSPVDDAWHLGQGQAPPAPLASTTTCKSTTSPTCPLLPTHHLQTMHPHFNSTPAHRHPNHLCNPCACSSQASYQNLNLLVPPHLTLFYTQAINTSTADISRHRNGVRRLKVIQVCRCPCHSEGY